jgi:hypothetical protein
VSSEETRLEVVRMALRSAQEALGVIVAADTPIDAGADPPFDMTGAMDDTAWATARPDLLTQQPFNEPPSASSRTAGGTGCPSSTPHSIPRT